MKDPKDTIVALSTPAGTGALAVIRLSGRRAIEIADHIYRGGKLSEKESHTLHYGHIMSNDDKVIDEVVLGLFRSPRSYTAEDLVEISCHGSSYIVQQVINRCVEEGARLAEPGEFSLRAFLNGRIDLSQAEAVAELIAAETEAEHQMAISQMRGGFSEEIRQLRQELIDFAALIELELDFSEEDVEFANRKDLKDLIEKIQGVISKLIKSFQLGNVIRRGVATVIAGRPNAGKSTLLNALLNEERAIVSEIPGTTRDTVEEIININGIKFRLIDTAGIREAQDKIEKMGVERTLEKINESSLVLYVFDVIETAPTELWKDVKNFLIASKALTEGSNRIFVANKMDLNPYTKPEDYYKEGLIDKINLIALSAKNNMNVEFLKEKLYNLAIGDGVNHDTIVSNARHHTALNSAHQSLREVTEGMQSNRSSELIALDIRKALNHLGEITGEISTDDLLDSIFGRFCIGK